MTRPSEAISGVVGSIVGAVLIILGAFTAIEVDTTVAGAITLLVAWIATAVTAFIASRQRQGELTSAPDGKVGS